MKKEGQEERADVVTDDIKDTQQHKCIRGFPGTGNL